MAERTDYSPGTPSWVDLSTTDPAAAKSFYAAVFGWDYDEMTDADEGTYIMCQKNGKPVAGMMQQPDVDATTAKVEGAGGAVVSPPSDIVDAGRMAVIADPTGAAICLWQPKKHVGAALVNEPGTFCWNELLTPDVEKAAKFYADVIGWTSESMDMGEMTYTVFKNEGNDIAGAMPPPMEGIPPNWGVYFAVDDCDGTVATAKTNGGSVLAEPMDIPPGRFAVLADPQGATFAVMKLAQEPQ